MKRSLLILSFAVMAVVLPGCTAMMNMTEYGTSDLYRTDNRAVVAARLKAEAEVARLEAQARQAQWEARVAQANASAAEAEYYAVVNQEPNFSNIVVDDYQSAYARRLYGFQSPTYNMPSSYYDMLNSSAMFYVTAYDPAYYNIMVSGDQVWVEPKYITSMFGSWGATNVTFGIYASPWNYGWNYHVGPFYYSMWGYPRYSWYDWNWNICYNPFYYDWYWGGYYPHHHHHHHHPVPPPPAHRPGNKPGNHPGNVTGPGASVGPGNLNGNRVNTGSRYTSPTSNRNYGATDSRVNGRPTSGSTSQGFNSNSVRQTTNVNAASDVRNRVVESNTRVNTYRGTTNGSSVGTSQGSSNFRQSTSQSSGTRNNSSSSSSSRVGSSSSSRSSSSNTFRSSSSSQSGSFRSSGSSSSSSRSSSGSSGSFRSSSSSGSSRR